MFQAPQNFKEHQQLFRNMTPQQLCLYCEQHPSYSLPAGILNYRTRRALDVMKNHALWLPQIVRASLASYIQNTFSQGQIAVTPHKMYNIYASLLKKHAAVSDPLRQAITEFIGFARAPMTPEKKEMLNKFVAQITPEPQEQKPRKATPFELGMERYKQQTSLFPHQK